MNLLRSMAAWALLVLAGVHLSAPAHAGNVFSLPLVVPIEVDVVTNPVAVPAPSVTGNFTYTVGCATGAAGPPPYSFASPALTLTATALATPFVPLLAGEASDDVQDNSNPLTSCTVTQTGRPTPPSGYFWSSTPVAPVVVTSFQNQEIRLLAATSSFSNTLVPAITITTVVNPPGAGSIVCTPNPVPYGQSSTCTVTASSGFTMINTTGCGGGFDGPTYFTNSLISACTITANFQANTVPITTVVNPPLSGSLTCTANPVNFGATSSCAATAATGYTLSNIAGCGGSSTSSPMTTGAVTVACTVTATFALNSYVVSAVASPLAGGSVSCGSPVNHGSTTACTASANPGYTYTGMSGCFGVASAATPYTTGPVTANCTVTGSFTINTFIVSALASPLAGGSVTCASPVNFNATSNCTAVANTGYTLTAISGCGGTAVTASPYSTGPVTANCTVTGTFTLNSYVITTVVSPAAGGTLVCLPNPVNHGSTATCTATPSPGYSIAPLSAPAANGNPATAAIAPFGITGCGGTASASNPFTTGAISAACTVTASFVLNTFTVSGVASPPVGGSVACTSPVAFNTTSSCTATANTGYTFTTISGCGGTAATASPYTTGPVTANCTVTGVFTLNSYAITTAASPAAGGTLSCVPNPVNFGATSVCTATANAGYALSGMAGCGGTPSVTSPYSTGPMASACSVTATFQTLFFAVTTVVLAGGGTLSCAPNPVAFGGTATCTAVASVGYSLMHITGCGGLATTTSPFVSAPITAACTVTGVFAVTPVAAAIEVPTQSAWAYVWSALLTALLGCLAMRRRAR